jgi:hypothetical protein
MARITETEATMRFDQADRATEHRKRAFPSWLAGAFLAALAAGACSPTVKVEPPKEPITINLNIKVDAEVRVKLEEKAKEDIQANPNVF